MAYFEDYISLKYEYFKDISKFRQVFKIGKSSDISGAHGTVKKLILLKKEAVNYMAMNSNGTALANTPLKNGKKIIQILHLKLLTKIII